MYDEIISYNLVGTSEAYTGIPSVSIIPYRIISLSCSCQQNLDKHDMINIKCINVALRRLTYELAFIR